MTTISAHIIESPCLSAQLTDGIALEADIINESTALDASVQEGVCMTAGIMATVLLCAALVCPITFDAGFLPDELLDGPPCNFITADGYCIQTADGALFCVKEEE